VLFPLTGWRAFVAIIVAVVIVALLLTALFWLGVLLVTLAAVAWFNIFLLPSVSARTRIPPLVLALALLPILAAIGYGLGGTVGLIGGSAVWAVGVALPRAALLRLRRRSVDRQLTTVDARFSSRTPVR
jgi:hypothetical protein